MEYAILTNEITKAWSGFSTKQYKNFKNLKKENLRDNMINLELMLNMLGEVSTTESSKKHKLEKHLKKNKLIRKKGGGAGITRNNLEKKLGKGIVSSQNAKSLLR